MPRRINNLPRYKPSRRHLRNEGTPAEAVLWGYLKRRQLHGRRFRRQHSVGPYILDFYGPEERLAVELDGAVHATPQPRAYDAPRDRDLAQDGIRVIRFENRSVFESAEAVLAAIAAAFRDPTAHEVVFSARLAFRQGPRMAASIPRLPTPDGRRPGTAHA